MRRLLILLALALATTLLTAPSAGAVGEVSDTVNIRLPGGANDPARLALRYSRATFPDGGADRVLLATEETFADALASGTLQGSDTPLLLTAADDVRSDVGTEIDRLGATTVTILGGTAAIDTDVEEELTDNDIDVDRLAGATRIDTAVEIARLAPESSTAIVARAFGDEGDESRAFADSLSAASLAAENGWPSFLTATDALSEATRDALDESGIEDVIVMGGPVAVSEDVVAEISGLGIDVERIAGQTRFSTAIEVARLRGFDSAADAESVILVEGQADDAWAGGFPAAAHSALNDAPIVLANGPTLPPETLAWLQQATFAVDVDDVTDPVLICAADPVACDLARDALGLPMEATIVIEEPEDGIPSRSAAAGIVELFGNEADVTVFGPCVQDGLVVPDEDGNFELDVQGTPGVCPLEFEVAFDNGSVQMLSVPVLVAPAVPKAGVVIDTETGGDFYTIVPEGAEAPLDIAYTAEDVFSVDGEPATIGAFEAAITVADQVTFSADTAEGDVHDLVDVDATTLTDGTIGNVNLAADTAAIVEPVSGVALRPDIAIPEDATYQVDGVVADLEAFEADVNEGDLVELAGRTIRLTNDSVVGPVRDLDVDVVSGVARFRIGGLGDDPFSAENERFRAVGDNPDQDFRVDGTNSTFQDFVADLTPGDQAIYQREDGRERFQLLNRAADPVEGLVTETFNPDGSPVAPEPEDGGDVVVLTAEGRRLLSYSADAEFRIDDQLATEAEFETARTPGDELTYQAPDTALGVAETVSLDNRDLTGDIADIVEGANTYDVVTLEGVVYDDLPYTDGVFGGDDVYFADGEEIDLREFEDLLGLIDDGEQQATIVVRSAGGNTEHRLTFLDA